MSEVYKRPSWDEYFLSIMKIVGTRGTCDRGRSGCVIARDNRILSTGYVDAPNGFPTCDEVGHKMETWTHDGIERQHCVRTVHAEQNAIINAMKNGVSLEGATLYCSMTPCDICSKMIINSGISRIVCEKVYHASQENEFYKKVGITLDVINNEVEKYDNQ